MAEYYGQRASDGGFIIGEATNISVTSRGWLGAPGLYTDDQVEGWKKVLSAVHSKGGHMFAQLWHTGRSSHVTMTGGANSRLGLSESILLAESRASRFDPGRMGATFIRIESSPWPRLAQIVQDYKKAAKRAQLAGFEGVELHSANGYLMDQFLQDSSNKRTDEYGGSVAKPVALSSASGGGTGFGLG